MRLLCVIKAFSDALAFIFRRELVRDGERFVASSHSRMSPLLRCASFCHLPRGEDSLVSEAVRRHELLGVQSDCFVSVLPCVISRQEKIPVVRDTLEPVEGALAEARPCAIGLEHAEPIADLRRKVQFMMIDKINFKLLSAKR